MRDAMDVVRLIAVAAALGLGGAVGFAPSAWADEDTAAGAGSTSQSDAGVASKPSGKPSDRRDADSASDGVDEGRDADADDSDSGVSGDSAETDRDPDSDSDEDADSDSDEQAVERAARNDAVIDTDADTLVVDTNASATVHDSEPAPLDEVAWVTPADESQTDVSVVAVDDLATPTTEFRPVRELVRGILGLFGFDPTPAPGHTNNPLLEGIWALFRRIESFVANSRPRFTSEIITDDIEEDELFYFPRFQIQALDDDDDPLILAVDDDADHGKLVAQESGGYTYLAPADFRGTDSFTITAYDNGFHLQNLGRLFNPAWGQKTTTTFTVTISAAAEPRYTVVSTVRSSSA